MIALLQRFYSVEVSLSLVAHLAASDPQGFATDPCSIHGGTISFAFPRNMAFHRCFERQFFLLSSAKSCIVRDSSRSGSYSDTKVPSVVDMDASICSLDSLAFGAMR
jgi:hypothetical protein